MKNLLNISDLNQNDFEKILQFSEILNTETEHILTNKNIGLIFEKNSTRTRLSFQVGINQLKGKFIDIKLEDLNLQRIESFEDTFEIISCYLDALIFRTTDHKKLDLALKYFNKPIINALSDLSHPCQILADLMTYKEISANKLEKVCWIGDGNNVCNSYIEASKILDFELSIFCPKEHSPNPSFLEFAKETTSFANSREKAAKGADIITTDVWVSMGDKKTKEKAFEGYFVDTKLIENTGKKSIFLHCLPAHRGQEITFELMEHPSSKVLEQAENRMHVQEALIENLLG